MIVKEKYNSLENSKIKAHELTLLNKIVQQLIGKNTPKHNGLATTSSVQTYKVRLKNEDYGLDVTIDCRSDTYILDAAEEQGIELPYSSRVGADGTSAGYIYSGTIDQSDQSYLSDCLISLGFVLLDVAYPTSDCTIITHQEENLYGNLCVSGMGDVIVTPPYQPANIVPPYWFPPYYEPPPLIFTGSGPTPNHTPDPNKPCVGDPIKDPRLTPSSPTNKQGGRNGNTRKRKDGSPKYHDGTDITMAPGTDVYSCYNGVVVDTRNSFSPNEYRELSYGNYISIKTILPNGDELILTYNHLNGLNVTNGDQILAGQKIGVSGTTGNASDPDMDIIPHLQARLKQLADGIWQRVNPENYLSTKFDEQANPINPNPCNP